MTEREKVIKALECCPVEKCRECPYVDGVYCNAIPKKGESMVEIPSGLIEEALELLKAQEPVAPYMDYDGQDVWRCGSCGATLFHLSHTQADENEQNCVKFCRYCGKAVKWDG